MTQSLVPVRRPRAVTPARRVLAARNVAVLQRYLSGLQASGRLAHSGQIVRRSDGWVAVDAWVIDTAAAPAPRRRPRWPFTLRQTAAIGAVLTALAVVAWVARQVARAVEAVASSPGTYVGGALVVVLVLAAVRRLFACSGPHYHITRCK
jgi:hypothetical protein